MLNFKWAKIALLQKQFLIETHRFNEAVDQCQPSEVLQTIRNKIDKITTEIAQLRATLSPTSIQQHKKKGGHPFNPQGS
ncbi:MAG: hypothetical protein JWN76_2425 [Chitinophagaceae bacterium]|nr:hypothetical protein [Chitinophagaceae bacterium]